MKSLVIALILIGSAIISTGQIRISEREDSKPQGKIRSVTYQRTYLIWKRMHADQAVQKLYTAIYDDTGNLIQSSVFGNIEKRTQYEYSGRTVKTHVQYFDTNGNPVNDSQIQYQPPWDELSNDTLCSEFSTKIEAGAEKTVENQTETCKDGSIRFTRTIRKNEKDWVVWESERDAKGRTREYRFEYDANGVETKNVYTTNNLVRPPYWVEIQYADTRFDKQDNWIRSIGTAIYSTYPNEPTYQFVEERIITYYD